MNIDDKNKINRIYARVSTTDQVSTTAQIDAITTHLKDKLSMKVDRVIEEKKSAKDMDGIYDPIDYMKLRPKFYNECYLPALRHEYNVLWVWKWDRFARSKFREIIFDMFDDSNVRIMALRDSNEPIVRDIHGALAREEIRKIQERVELRHQELLKKGRVLNKPPLGYTFKRHKLVPDENIEAVKKAFELTLKGLKPKEICSQITIKKKKEVYCLPITTYKRLLRNKTYAGIYSYRGEERKGNFETPLKGLFNQVQEMRK